MDDNVWIKRSTMTRIGDSIRGKTGSAELILPDDMPEAIDGITGGSITEVDVIPETTVPFVNTGAGLYAFSVPNPDSYTVIEGKKYVVVWDGVKYKEVCKEIQIYDSDTGEFLYSGLYVGNASYIDTTLDNTAQPFAMIKSYAGMVVVTKSTSETHVIRIYTEETGGNIDSDLVKFVTFMNEDGTELYVKPTINGDDCVNVVSKGLIPKPTKESNPQYNYTYSGWSLTPGGAADSNALKNITEDRVLYAAFTATVRSYTITYNDSDGSFLYSESLQYGTMPDYVAEKDGSSFDHWEPALATVTGDATYTAHWLEMVTFAGGTWADIARISEAGEAQQYFALGDTRDIQYNGGTMSVEIVGFDHDDLSDGSGKAGISIMCTKTSNNKIKTYTTSNSSTNRYNNSNLHSALQTEVFGYLPEDLQTVIKAVNKQYISAPATTGAGGKTIGTISEKVFVPSMNELNIVSSVPSGFDMVLGTKYQRYVQNGIEALDAQAMDGSTAYSYWLRDDSITSNGNYWNNTGQLRVLRSSNKYSISSGSGYAFFVRFGFCI